MTSVHPVVRTLSNRRRALGLSQRTVSLTANIHPNSLLDWERGHYEPRMRAFIRWAEALGYNVVLQPKD